MGTLNINYKIAEIADTGVISELMQEYYEYEGLKLDKLIAYARLKELIEKHELGNIWLININESTAGYVVTTNGFGLEHGRNVTIDEFYIRDGFRGQGIGKKTIKFIKDKIYSIGITSIHTEVKRKNIKARLFWESCGFQKYDRYPMVSENKE